MAALASLDDHINIATGGGAVAQDVQWVFKAGRVSGAAAVAPIVGQWTSLWQYAGNGASSGAMPGGTARNPTRATAGAIPIIDPTGGRQKWITGWALAANVQGSVLLMDRLADMSGFSGTTTSAQNTTSLAVTRYTGTAAAGNQIWIEIGTQIGATATTITASYTNEAGTASRTTVAVVFGGTNRREAQRLIQLPLQAGDLGVRSVQSVTVLASTLTAGDFCVIIARPLDAMVLPYPGVGTIRTYIDQPPGPIEFQTGGALFYAWMAQQTTVPDNIVSFISAQEK